MNQSDELIELETALRIKHREELDQHLGGDLSHPGKEA